MREKRLLASLRVISGFRREVDENCALLGYNTASGGNSLTTFRDLGVKNLIKNLSWLLKLEQIT